MIEILILAFFALIWIFWQQYSEHQKIQQQIESTIKEKLLPVSVEVHNGITYWFESETDRFIAQGATDNEIIADVKTRFPNNIFVLPNGTALFAPLWKPTKMIEVDK